MKLHKKEFPTFNVPEEISNNPLFTDISWHNDAFPRFIIKGTPYILSVDHQDPKEREFDTTNRFMISEWSNATGDGDWVKDLLSK